MTPENPGTPTAGGRIVYTIGHGTRSFSEVAHHLHRHRIGLIVDIRSVPYSRHAPDFTKARLEAAARQVDLGYRWLGDRLGGRPTDPAAWRGDRPDLEVIAAGPAFDAGLRELDGLVAASTVVLLCAELDHRHCHRSTLVAPAVEARGHRIRHLLPDGDAVDHQPVLDLGR